MSRHVIALVVLLLISLAGNASLAWIARLSNERVATLRDMVQFSPVRARLVPGEPAPPLRVKTLAGVDVDPLAEKSPLPTVLYVFSPDCRWCIRNQEAFQTLVKETAGRYRIVALSLTRQGLSTYLSDNDFGTDVFMEPSSETTAAYNLLGTPMTVLVNPEGIIERVWLGAFSREVRTEVQELFGVKLPDLPPTNPADPS